MGNEDTMRLNEPIQDCIMALRLSRPDIAVTVTRKADSYFSWDGDGDDPRNEGFEPCDVYVKAFAIKSGTLLEGSACLGGSYYRPDEFTGDIHGYLPQMLEEAIEELDKAIALAE